VINPGKLYLLPVPISDEDPLAMIPEFNLHLVRTLTHFITEDEKQARKNLKLFGYPDLPSAQLYLLNEHTSNSALPELLKPLLSGHDTALMSDAGCPGIADPGAELIRLAHTRNIRVIPLTGPSSIVLAIMASGFNGQNFAFNGYLPVDKAARIKRLRELESLSRKQGQAQFFIETPYRNAQLLETMLECLAPGTYCFVGKNIGGVPQFLRSATVADWKKQNRPDLHKIPVVFGLYC